MRILVTNDDGVFAPGIAALRAIALEFGDVTVVAPATQQSAVSHSITFTHITANPVRVGGEDGFDAISVEGSPADCVRLAVLKLLDEPPDIVLSGINTGANVGVHVLYSGTVSAAAEGAILGLPAVALSAQGLNKQPDIPRAAKLAAPVLRSLLERPLAAGELVNVNIPAAPKKPKGVKVTRHSCAESRDGFDAISTHATATTYAIRGGEFTSPSDDTDIIALGNGYITVTPLTIDRTDHERLESLKSLERS